MKATVTLDEERLAATPLTPRTRLWTRDKKLRSMAQELGAGHLSG